MAIGLTQPLTVMGGVAAAA